jgi:hypothetical protein
MRYEIDLTQYAFDQNLPTSSTLEWVNRGNPTYTAQLTVAAFDKDLPYAAYQCITSCGADVGLVTEEAIWSHCGRYLAVVAYAAKPDVPKTIKIVDYQMATVIELPGTYALPSLMWFDETMLEFSHIVAINETATAHNPWRQQANRINVDNPEHKDNLYDLLIASLDKRRADMDKKAHKMQTQDSYCSGSVDVISQHCILFAPDFAKPLLQPPN